MILAEEKDEVDDGERTIELDLEVVQTTRWALLVTDGDKQAWLAKSLLRPLNEGVDDCDVGESATFTLPEWLAMEKELV